MTTRTRFPSAVFKHGSEPDPRFSLANERTFLAWIRTALALILTGVAIEALDPPLPDPMEPLASVIFVIVGGMVALHSLVSWTRNERALRQGQPLPGFATASALTLVISSLAFVSVGLAILL